MLEEANIYPWEGRLGTIDNNAMVAVYKGRFDNGNFNNYFQPGTKVLGALGIEFEHCDLEEDETMRLNLMKGAHNLLPNT